jgi:hypothetical protein
MSMKHTDNEVWLDLRQAFRAGDLVEPPEWVRERAKRAFGARPGAGRSLLAHVRARLLFDSRQSGLATAGVRSLAVFEGALEGPWQLLYRGGDVDVDLLVRPNQDGRTLHVRGQALSLIGEDVGAGVVEALPADLPRRLRETRRAALRSEVDRSGEFALSNLERGRYDVLLRFGAHEIELSDVEL